MWKKYTWCDEYFLSCWAGDGWFTGYSNLKEEKNPIVRNVKPGKFIYWHKNCNWRRIKTKQERTQNCGDILDRRDVRKKYGKGFKINRIDLPDPWEDFPIHGTKSWKKIHKKRKQWMK